jgi:Cys-rich repeat protein
MRRRAALLMVLLLVLPWLGCAAGQECDRCSSDSDCKSGFVCTSFSDGSKRCGTGVGATTCRVR